MPDKDGKLSEADRQKISNWLNKRWRAQRNCTVCGTNNWSIGEHVVTTARLNNKGQILMSGAAYPYVMVICNYCANTMAFNAPMLGLVENKAAAQKNKDVSNAS